MLRDGGDIVASLLYWLFNKRWNSDIMKQLLAVAALHHSWTSATSGLRGLFLITCRQNFFVCEAPSGARPSAVADVADA
ncbi:hypothetical protein EVAR_46941_1 [Eumeta japonica]|uniref:Uncharacterized protein n=1 Tax=Eumeta variegata TaxID=151549 RepID=A0A4C1YLX2_EUMVA|nr:hypothetical protein EVAR_46941_1 [Eumeta japonica]